MTTHSSPLRQQYYKRFGPAERMEHMALLVSFTMLAVTGLPQRYSEYQIAKDFINVLGGIESVRILHRFFAIILMAGAIYHGGAVSYKIYVRGARLNMIPGVRDLRDAIHFVMHNLGLRKDHPRMPRFNFGEKVEYLAVVWGTLVMIVTGFMMWNPVLTNDLLPGAVIPIARLAHSMEAVLAVLSILVWHMYNVHLKRFNRSMFTGKLSYEEMAEEHAEELDLIEHGEADVQVPPEVIAKRQRRFFPYAVGMSITLVAALIFFVTYETSSIETVPRQERAIIAPVFEAEEGFADTGAGLWKSVRCASCHGEDALGLTGSGPAILHTELSYSDFYFQVRLGENQMPAFSTGELSDAGLLDIYAWLISTEE
jgi:formate dehydrogenase gamma subunit